MLSYLHSFHAGNHADVLKHALLSLALARIREAKDKPFTYMDSHAAGGVYDLLSSDAEKTGEAKNGILKMFADPRLRQAAPEYIEAIEKLNAAVASSNDVSEGENQTELASCPRFYPGSHMIAASIMREYDKLILIELHSSEIERLKTNTRRDPRVSVHKRDGFEGISALTPPEIKRGLLLIDPSYEKPSDYHKTIETSLSVLKRWPGACVMIWYPLLAGEKDHGLFMSEKLRKSGAPDSFTMTFCPSSADESEGMRGSAMTVLNAPWKLREEAGKLAKALNAMDGSSQACLIRDHGSALGKTDDKTSAKDVRTDFAKAKTKAPKIPKASDILDTCNDASAEGAGKKRDSILVPRGGFRFRGTSESANQDSSRGKYSSERNYDRQKQDAKGRKDSPWNASRGRIAKKGSGRNPK